MNRSDNGYDVVVIGGGPGGYVAAIRAAQLENRVAIVEKDALGGICLNWGCIPTKALLRNAEVLHTVKHAGDYGIAVAGYSVDFRKAVERSRKVAKRLSKGIEFLMKKNGITHIKGTGTLVSSGEVKVALDGGDETVLQTRRIIVATGARNLELPGLSIDRKRSLTSTEAMVLKTVPKKMIIIGAGAIGVEFATFYHEYGTEIHLVEMLPRVLPLEDEEISDMLAKLFEKRGIRVHTSTRVEKIESLKTKVKVHVKAGDAADVLDGEIALVAVGVQGNVEGIGLEEVGVRLENGWIKVNEFYETTVKGIYAIGDVIGPPWLAHVASAEGRVAAEHASGKSPRPLNYDNIPACTYSRPEVASVGLTEKGAVEAGHDITIGRFPMRASGKALAMGESEGMVKMVVDKAYGEILGCHIIGPGATELIAEVAAARTAESTYREILETVHAHPTLSETLMEAAAAAVGEVIHI